MTGKCPILFENNQKKYQLTNQEIREFCKLGCSADCDIYLKEYVNISNNNYQTHAESRGQLQLPVGVSRIRVERKRITYGNLWI